MARGSSGLARSRASRAPRADGSSRSRRRATASASAATSGNGNGNGATASTKDSSDSAPKPEFDKFSVYFNLDNGTGKIRGVHLQENAAAAPIFEACMKPFHDLGMDTLTMRNTGGTDHLSFDAVGIPGFQFIQDPIEYDTRTHHSNMDVYDRLQPDDLKQMAVIVASFVYMAAQRDEKFPRKPIEPPLPPPPPPQDDENAAPPSRPPGM